MKLRTQEMLSDFVAGDIAWRKKELGDLRHIAQTAGGPARRQLMTRCAIALMYAHLEGFTKQAGRAYLEYVAAQKLTNDQIAQNFLALTLADMLASVHASRKPSAYARAVQLLASGGAERARVPYKTGVDTESNLSSRVLQEVIYTLGLDYSPYASKEKLLDSRLLAKRNHIAHGENVQLDDVDYDELHYGVIEMMECLRNQIENAAALRSFVRAV